MSKFLYDPRAIHRFPIFKFKSFGILFGRQLSYGVMGLWPIFSILCNLVQISFWPNVRFSIFFGHFSSLRYVRSIICLSAICPFDQMAFGSYVLSVICLSVKCPFGHLSYDHLSYHHQIIMILPDSPSFFSEL